MINRRQLLKTLGAISLSAGATSNGQQSEYAQDSFGNQLPIAPDAVRALADPAGSGTRPNILLVMVDQLRYPRWLPAGGQADVDTVLPNIALLRNHSFVFSNFFASATSCSPARAALLTGLYSQQTCLFETQPAPGGPVKPDLNAGFLTFGDALASTGYDTCWLGKWHLSNNSPGSGNDLSTYGFDDPKTYPGPKDASPNGLVNQGTEGNNPFSPFNPGTPNPGVTAPDYEEYNDAAICQLFLNWLDNSAPASTPWFCAVSFINPHDITAFPFGFDLTLDCPSPVFTCPSHPPTSGYVPPPATGEDAQNYNLTPAYIPPAPSLYSALPAGWNGNDVPAAQLYGNPDVSTLLWKPAMQAYFQKDYLDPGFGAVENGRGWISFFNLYFWMQACADYQIGQVMNALQSSPFAENTIVIFLSDHGEFGGSHALHTKGGALYDEALNVPLFVSFPNQRATYVKGDGSMPAARSYTCAGVDFLPFLYRLATGNDNWRHNPNNPFNYLSNREAIMDAIQFNSQARQYRIAPSSGLPYIIHTTDEFTAATYNGVAVPPHAIAFRTSAGKLGIYSNWQSCSTTPADTPAQYEFYDYASGNAGETGNNGILSYASGVTTLTQLASTFLSDFNSVAPGELYNIYSSIGAPHASALAAYLGDQCAAGARVSVRATTVPQECTIPRTGPASVVRLESNASTT